jgi:Protein of unknown function (Hypoth_ymh)
VIANVPAAIDKLNHFLQLVDRYEEIARSDISPFDPRYKAAYESVMTLMPIIERIAGAAQPGVKHDFSASGFTQFSNAEDVALRVRGLLQQQDELQAILGPKGPTLSAAGLHPWVWTSAASLWDTGHRRQAIQAAATHLEIQLQAKVDRPDLSGKPLVQEAFSTSQPKPGQSRLRFSDYAEGTEAWTSAHEGALNFGLGCVQRIRNLATHELDQPVEQEAIEELAALSTLARWIDTATVVRTS